MVKRIFLAGVFASLIFSLAFPAFAQIQVAGPDFRDVKYVSDHVQDDTAAEALESAALWFKYVGSQESGLVAEGVAANSITLYAGPLGSETNSADGADVNTGDVCGSANNALDYTNAACDTPEELCNVVNAANANWVCVLGAALGSDSFGTDHDYVADQSRQAKQPGGAPVFIDNSATDTLAWLMRPDIGYASRPNLNNLGRGDIEFFLRQSAPGSADLDDRLIENPFANRRAVITSIVAYANSTSAWTLSVYARKYRADGAVDERLVYQTVDTVDVTDEILDFSRAPLVSGEGETFLVQILDDALVDGKISVNGFFVNSR